MKGGKAGGTGWPEDGDWNHGREERMGREENYGMAQFSKTQICGGRWKALGHVQS